MDPVIATGTTRTNQHIRQTGWVVIGLVIISLLGMEIGYLRRERQMAPVDQQEIVDMYARIHPADGYALPISYGNLGPQLMENGVIGYDAFASIYQNAGTPLSSEQIEILQQGSDEKIVINSQNAHFLLNVFWAVGLANQNPILTEGAMVQPDNGQLEDFASTGGWTLATRPVTEVYASLNLIPLTAQQQKRVEEVAAGVYRPCCNNPTIFPDCNHGMAMLGVLELMASQGAGVKEMFEAAKYINAYWFPQQTLETAIYLGQNQNMTFAETDPRLVVSKELSSASGAGRVHGELQSKGLLPQVADQGESCAN
jgi:hypothetical protein